MSDLTKMIGESAARLFADTCTEPLRLQAEDGIWPHALWEQSAELGLTAIYPGDDEDELDLSALATIAEVAGAHAVPLPLVENLLAHRALAAANMDAATGKGPCTIAGLVSDLRLCGAPGAWRLSGTLMRVPWGRDAECIVAVAESDGGHRTVAVRGAGVSHTDANCAREPRDTFVFDAWAVPDDAVSDPGTGMDAASLYREAALVRSAQMAGAMQSVLDMTVRYTRERVQFGRAIGQFQAVQHQVVEMASQAAAAKAAVEAAALVGRGGAFEAAVAKLRASEAAGAVIAGAHQVHGAMGFTYEHPLRFHTRRLMAWRDEYGSDAEWACWIGDQVARVGGDGLWAMIVAPEHYRDLQTN
ncbi:MULTISPECIES: acyl-CoA dehydrogenase family protein [Xanthobacter]|uniref:acyl-CoA dehydrogenase family protein n=1 Tax=Xanthobacter TaxID=279 RepID=UPI0032B56495